MSVAAVDRVASQLEAEFAEWRRGASLQKAARGWWPGWRVILVNRVRTRAGSAQSRVASGCSTRAQQHGHDAAGKAKVPACAHMSARCDKVG